MASLALLGGKKLVEERLGKPWPIVEDLDRKLVAETLDSGKWFRHSPERSQSKVFQFEQAFAKFQDATYAVATTNGTTALECALKAVGVEAGDEVLVSTITFIASVTSILLVNAIPVFVDVDPTNWNISPAACEAAITPKTKAIMAVDHAGIPCDMDALNALREKHGVTIISDCAHAHGSQWKGRGVGALGQIGAFSFQQGKTLSTGEGGMVMTNDPELAQSAGSVHDFGRREGGGFYRHYRLASNLRMHEMQGALGLAQLTRLESQVKHREAQIAHLEAGMKQIDGIEALARDPRVTRFSFYYYPFRINSEKFDGVSRDTFLAALGAEGVGCWTGHIQPLWKQPMFTEGHFGKTGCPMTCPFHGEKPDYSKVHLPVAERIATEGCAFSHAMFLGPQSDMDKIIEAMRKVRSHTDELLKHQKEHAT